MVRSRQVTILAMAGSVAKSRLLRLACESIERICETGDVWPGPCMYAAHARDRSII